jgi:hypothetical protein
MEAEELGNGHDNGRARLTPSPAAEISDQDIAWTCTVLNRQGHFFLCAGCSTIEVFVREQEGDGPVADLERLQRLWGGSIGEEQDTARQLWLLSGEADDLWGLFLAIDGCMSAEWRQAFNSAQIISLGNSPDYWSGLHQLAAHHVLIDGNARGETGVTDAKIKEAGRALAKSRTYKRVRESTHEAMRKYVRGCPVERNLGLTSTSDLDMSNRVHVLHFQGMIPPREVSDEDVAWTANALNHDGRIWRCPDCGEAEITILGLPLDSFKRLKRIWGGKIGFVTVTGRGSVRSWGMPQAAVGSDAILSMLDKLGTSGKLSPELRREADSIIALLEADDSQSE